MVGLTSTDVPINSEKHDALGRKNLVKRLAEILVDGEGAATRATRLVIGLSGQWGSGKSSIMLQLAEKLRTKENVHVVEFNPWVFQDQSSLLDAFFDEMRSQLGSSNNEKLRKVVESLDAYRDAISPIAEMPIPGGGLVKGIIPKKKEVSALKQKKNWRKNC